MAEPIMSCTPKNTDANILKDSDIKMDFVTFYLKNSKNNLQIPEKALSLQQIIKAPPFFLEWIWPSEDGFFIIQTLAIWHNA